MKFTRLLLLCLLSLTSNAQHIEFLLSPRALLLSDSNDVPVSFPFLGGINGPVFQFFDADFDDDPDLFLKGEDDRLLHFDYFPPHTNPLTLVEDSPYRAIELGTWFKLVDFDFDGDADLFTDDRSGGLLLHLNTGDHISPQFEAISGSLNDSTGRDIYADPLGMPDWADIDNDGDADLFVPNQNDRIVFYEAVGYGQSGAPIYHEVTITYQNILLLDTGMARSADLGNRHGAKILRFQDVDADGDSDLFAGSFFTPWLFFLENTGSADSALFVAESLATQYPEHDPLVTIGNNLPNLADFDLDGDMDLFVSALGALNFSVQDHIDNVYFLENTGTPQNPHHELQTRMLLQTLDLGHDAIPAVGDLNNDGDLDLIVGVSRDAVAADNSRLHYFENIGSHIDPFLRHTSADLLQDDIPMDYSYAPELVDLSGDGLLDLIVGTWDGRMMYFRNEGSTTDPVFTKISDAISGINVGNYAVPAFFDYDADRDYDLFAGSHAGLIKHYQNIGSASEPRFELVDDNFMDIDVGERSHPSFGDINGDGDDDFLIGSSSGEITLYRNILRLDGRSFVLDSSANFPAFYQSAPVLADMDYDRKPELLVGTAGGGIAAHRNVSGNFSGIQAEPIHVHFDNVLVGIPDSQLVTLYNPGHTTQMLGDINTSVDLGDELDFSLERSDLTAGSQSNLLVIFTPGIEGSRSATLAMSTGLDTLEITVTAEVSALPMDLALQHPYPNPFHTEVTFSYSLNVGTAEISKYYDVKIFDVLGRQVREWKFLLTQPAVQGELVWDGFSDSGMLASSGLYFIQLLTPNGEQRTKKVLLVR